MVYMLLSEFPHCKQSGSNTASVSYNIQCYLFQKHHRHRFACWEAESSAFQGPFASEGANYPSQGSTCRLDASCSKFERVLAAMTANPHSACIGLISINIRKIEMCITSEVHKLSTSVFFVMVSCVNYGLRYQNDPICVATFGTQPHQTIPSSVNISN